MWDTDLPLLDPPIRKRILRAVDNKILPNPAGFGKPLRSPLAHIRSLRVGDYRILYLVEGDRSTILAAGHRSHIYEIALSRA